MPENPITASCATEARGRVIAVEPVEAKPLVRESWAIQIGKGQLGTTSAPN